MAIKIDDQGENNRHNGVNGNHNHAANQVRTNSDTINGHRAPVTLAICGAGMRGQMYAKYALEYPELAKVVAVADPNPYRRKQLAKLHSVEPEYQFTDAEAMAGHGRVADAVIIGSLDHLHAPMVQLFRPQGYHILCEKPMAPTFTECVDMYHTVNQDPTKVFGIGHVLRYSPYNRAVKEVIKSGVLGDIVNIKHIEPVGNQHFAHSYVRGNWRREDESSSSLMAKCCHDLDILNFYLDHLPPTKVSSFGGLFEFRKERKPAGAGNAKRCTDCNYESECGYSAVKQYADNVDGPFPWAKVFMDTEVLDRDEILAALKTNQYGRCVYESDNDVMDHQTVNIEYQGGVTATMSMIAFTEVICDRRTEIHGTKGELIGDMQSFTVFDFVKRELTKHVPPVEPGYHGGGDTGLARAFVKAVATTKQDELGVSPTDVLDSHLVVFAAEKARKESVVVDFQDFKKKCLSKPEAV